MKNEKGAVMVEAIIVFPIVLFTVFFLIYLNLFKLQEFSLIYQAQRAAHQGANIISNPGYAAFGIDNFSTKNIDLKEGKTYSAETYCKAFHKDLHTLYREILPGGGYQGKAQEYLDLIEKDILRFSGVVKEDTTATVKRNIFYTEVSTDVTFKTPMPGVVRFFIKPESKTGSNLLVTEGARSKGIYQAGHVRLVDLGSDILTIVTEKLGISDALNSFNEGIKKYVF